MRNLRKFHCANCVCCANHTFQFVKRWKFLFEQLFLSKFSKPGLSGRFTKITRKWTGEILFPSAPTKHYGWIGTDKNFTQVWHTNISPRLSWFPIQNKYLQKLQFHVFPCTIWWHTVFFLVKDFVVFWHSNSHFWLDFGAFHKCWIVYLLNYSPIKHNILNLILLTRN